MAMAQDYWHHWEDVCAGWFLGATVAYIFYRQHYPSLSSQSSGEPLVLSQSRQLSPKYSGLSHSRDTQPKDVSSELRPLGADGSIRDSSNSYTEGGQEEPWPSSTQGTHQAGYPVHALPV